MIVTVITGTISTQGILVKKLKNGFAIVSVYGKKIKGKLVTK